MGTHKYNNTVIQSNGGEHGKRIIEWWKEQGVDTKNFSGKIEKGWYYGLIDGEFAPHHSNAVIKASATIIELPESNPQDLIGRKVSTTQQKLFNYLSEELGVTVLASQIHDIERIVLDNQTSPQIINLSNVEGVEMMVSNDTHNWKLKKIVAKNKSWYYDFDGTIWGFAKPIEVKKITMQDVEKMFGCRVEIVKEVSNG